MNLRSRIAAGGIALAAAVTPATPAMQAAAVVGGGAAALTAASVVVAEPAQATGERVQNSIASSKSISISTYTLGYTQSHILGVGQGHSAGSISTITSFRCPSSTRCSYSFNGGASKTVTGPQTVTIPRGAAVSVYARW